jgi:hypothetical protein
LIVLTSASVSFAPIGIAGWSWPVSRRYSGLFAELPGTTAGPAFCPPFNAAARVLKSSCDIGWLEL